MKPKRESPAGPAAGDVKSFQNRGNGLSLARSSDSAVSEHLAYTWRQLLGALEEDDLLDVIDDFRDVALVELRPGRILIAVPPNHDSGAPAHPAWSRETLRELEHLLWRRFHEMIRVEIANDCQAPGRPRG